jgi:hypothetical protein
MAKTKKKKIKEKYLILEFPGSGGLIGPEGSLRLY